MLRLVQFKNGVSIQLENTPFASGGEGDLFKIANSYGFNDQVVKVYKPEKRTKEREAKIKFLIANPPNLQVKDGHQTVIWMNQIVYENGEFIGFVMPMGKGKELEFLCHEKKPKSLTSEWDKFNFSNKESVELRLKLCFNIAVAIYHIHKLGLYVLIDLKPQNILVQPNGLISIIDIDSVAVIKNDQIIFAAPVTTPEYTPPEYYKKSNFTKIEYIHEAWDRFSISVIFYRLLCGIHPFTGSCLSPYEKCHGLPEMVENGLFPHGLKKTYFKIIPSPHQNYNKLEDRIREAFRLCFDEGHNNAKKRPTANEWCQILSNQQLIQINRPLPSSFINFPLVNYSKSLIYGPSTLVAFPSVSYSQNLSISGFKKLINKIFKKSDKQLLIERIIEQEQILRSKFKMQEIFERELQDILKQFNNEQSFILEKEKEKIVRLKKTFDLQKEDNDKYAQNLFYQEQQELDIIAKYINNSIYSQEYSVESYYKINLQSRFESHENNKSTIQRKISNLQNQISTEIKLQINNPAKLSKYDIAKNALNIFSYYEAANIYSLNLYGIVTAADFTDADLNGLLKHRQKGWIKVPGIAKVRAKQLNDWRKQLELKEDLNIKKTIDSLHRNDFNIFNQSLNKLENDFKLTIQPFQSQYEKQKQDILLYKSELSKSRLEKNKHIKDKFNNIHQQLVPKYKEQKASLSNLLSSIINDTTSDLNNNKQNFTVLYLEKWKMISAYINEINNDIQTLY